MLGFIKKYKYIIIFFFGSILFLCGLVFIDASNQMRRAELATASYQKWANSSDGITLRRLQRDIDRQNRSNSINCYLENYGPDYDPTLDCPENLKPRSELTPPTAWVYPSIWYYSLPQRIFGNDLSKVIHIEHMKAIEYWETRGTKW
ncbi:hypothetical protein [Pseudomonas pohangensis]|uniref:hypothetical protein n=1 Tax=Pseudomonas pohangensis TaxID=364197 RepID=UPI0012FD5016|nr:hypothetical protein [Pseudomonas pohangensis]